MGQQVKNFTAADRKRNLIAFGLLPFGTDLSWIADNTQSPLPSTTVAYAPSPNFEISTGQIQIMTLTGNVVSSSITYLGSPTPLSGAQIILKVVQDGTGGWLFVLPANVKVYPSFQIDTTPNTATVMNLFYSGTAWEFAAPPVIYPA